MYACVDIEFEFDIESAIELLFRHVTKTVCIELLAWLVTKTLVYFNRVVNCTQ